MLKQKNILKNKAILSLVLGLAIFLFVYIFSFDSLNKIVHSSLLKVGNQDISSQLSDDIVIVGIDEKSLAEFGRFPFDRSTYTSVIKNLNDRGASVIGIDLIFADRSDEKTDNNLAKTIKEAGNIVLGGSILGGGHIELPLSAFYDAKLSFGYFTQDYENSFKVIHRYIPFRELNIGGEDKLVDHFSIAILKAYYSKLFKDESILGTTKYDSEGYFIGNKKIPLSGQGLNSLIRFVPISRFTEISFADVYDPEQLDLALNSLSNNGKKFSLEGKIVLIGTTAKGLKDIFNTPNGVDYGVQLHANIINTILTNNFYSYFDENLELVLIFLLIVAAFYLNLSRGGYVVVFSNIALVSVFLIIFPLFIYNNSFILNRPADLGFALILTLFISNTLKYLVENKNKIKLNKALSEYISKDIAKQILSGTESINLDGEKRNISIFFSDIAGFTSISEKFSPEDLVGFLRQYLGSMSHIIMDERGLIDKYEGDAIMALWGVFGYEDSSNYDNCKSALLQQEKLRELNSLWKENYNQELSVRMGLHCGEAIVGNVGATGRKMEFTALGDSVNLASRLEGVNKFYNTNICASEDIVNEVGDSFVFRYLDKIRVKGKKIPVKIYELVGFKDKVNKLKLEMISEFEKALKLYFDKDFEKAKEVFEKLASAGDKPSQIFAKRCETLNIKFEAKIPREGWDGVWDMKSK